MNKEFIPYNEALELKELGFNEPCFGKFYFNQLEIGGVWTNNDFKEDPDVFISAPLYQQAFRWFREKYKIHIVINLTIIDNWYFELYDLNDKRNAEIKTNENEFETYGEAELECLKKLIEIAKK